MGTTPSRTRTLAPASPADLPTDPARIAAAIDRVAPLLPEAAGADPRDLRACALTFVERYAGDVPQLEHEWEFVYAALLEASRRADDGAVVRLAVGLARIAGRLDQPVAVERALRLGIDACARSGDREHLAYLLDRLAIALFSNGSYQQGRALWHETLRLGESGAAAPRIRDPLSSFAQIADLLWTYDSARDFIASLPAPSRAEHPADRDTLAVALFASGLFARMGGRTDEARRDLGQCLRLLSARDTGIPATADRQLFAMAVQCELARARGDYDRSHTYAQAAIGLAHAFGDRYTVAALLIDQGFYAYRMGQPAHAREAMLGLRQISRRLPVPHVFNTLRFLESRLAPDAPGGEAPVAGSAIPSALAVAAPERPHEPLSRRELDVLGLVASGFSNREIAAQLVVTTGTVKKHLEHLYRKLSAVGRTSALARARALGLLP